MKKVGITGASGFVGTHLCKRLEELGYQVISSDANLDNEMPNFEACDHIIHLAALTFVPDSWKEPLKFYKTNTLGTAHVLEAARAAKIPMTYISSYVYGLPHYLPIDEQHMTSPASPYMQSKLMAEQLCEFYRDNFDLEICILRPFNLYGAGLADKFLIPLICQQVLDKEKTQVTLRSLSPKRDYVHIQDLVEAIAKSVENTNSETINIASGESYSVAELANMIMEIAEIQKEVVSTSQIRPNEIMDTKASINKAKEILGWQPNIKIEDGIRKIISEMQDNS